jgi:hypothetical protein
VITVNKQAVPSPVAQLIVVKYITNENVKPAGILMRLGAHIDE